MLSIQPSPTGCGATVRGLDLSKPMDDAQLAELRAVWLAHGVIALPEQHLSIEDLERFTLAWGPRGDDPFIAPIPGHAHVVEIRREPDERSKVFAEDWHSDWSFLPTPPAATALYSRIIPPVGGDTLFADQYAAWDALPAAMKATLKDRMGIHSARRGYSTQGSYGEKDRAAGRSMAIRFSDAAMKTQLHPIARVHPETGRTALFVSPGYTIGIDGMSDDEAQGLLSELFSHQGKDDFIYRHSWSTDMLLVWDNRCLVHKATGGYEGHRRLLQRVTIGERAGARASIH